MKRKIIIISLVVIFAIVFSIFGIYMYWNYRDAQISLIAESVIIEYGENYSPTVSELIDVSKYNFIDIDKITIKNEIVNEDNKNYAKVGEYFIHLYYKDMDLVQKVSIKDSISPEIIIEDEVILVPYNTNLENYNFDEYIKINDLSETNKYNIDFSNVKKEVAGEYVANITVSDIYENISQKEFKIIIQEKIEEVVTIENSSSNVGKENKAKTNSNQMKIYKDSNTKTSSKAPQMTNNSNVQANSSSNKKTDTQTNKPTQSELSYWCIEGGSHHVAGDSKNEHGYYSSWDSAYQAFQNYTSGWSSVQYKVSQCACGLYYFWAIQ